MTERRPTPTPSLRLLRRVALPHAWRAAPLPAAALLCAIALLAGRVEAQETSPFAEPEAKLLAGMRALEARQEGAAPALQRALASARRALEAAPPKAEEPLSSELGRDRLTYTLGRGALALARGSSDERGSLLAQARSAFRLVAEGGEERTATRNEWLRHYAYLGLVEALGEREEDRPAAIELASDLTFVDWWYEPERVPAGQKEIVARDEAHLHEVCLRAHVLLTRLHLDAEDAQAALEAAAAIEDAPQGRGWRARPGAVRLLAVRARAEARGGDAEGSLRELVATLRRLDRALRQPQKKGERGAGPSEARADFVAGCEALAELSAEAPASIGSPAGSFFAAFGHGLRGDAIRSLADYKQVLRLARTTRERQAWVPRAVREAGLALFQQERFLEAALAYQVVLREFPQDAFAPDAARFASSALRKCERQLGAAPQELARSLEAEAAPLLPASLRLANELKTLAEVERKKDWPRAARGYLDLARREPGTPLAARVLTRAGHCLYRASNGEAALEPARTRLREAITLAQKLARPEEEAEARRVLAGIELDLGNALAALELLAPLDGRLAQAASAARARPLQARAHLARGAADAAQRAQAAFEAAGALEPEARARFAYELVAGLRTLGERQARTRDDVAAGRAARALAGRYVGVFCELRPGGLTGLRVPVLAYLARAAHEGGQPTLALELARAALAGALRPKATNGGARQRSQADLSAFAQLDELETIEALSLASTGDPAARAALERIRRVAYLEDDRGRVQDRVLVTPGPAQRGRRVFQLERAGKEESWFEAKAPERAREHLVAPGADPSAPYRASDLRVLKLHFEDDYELLSALAARLWAEWNSTQAQALLVQPGGLGTVLDELLRTVRRMQPDAYGRIAARQPAGTLDLQERRWEVEIEHMKLSLALQRWGRVLSELRLAERLGRLKTAPPRIQAELARLKRAAEGRR